MFKFNQYILYILYIIFFISIAGCTNKRDFILFNKADINQSTENEKLRFENINFEYKVMPHDRVSLIIYKHPELSPTTLGNRTSDRGILVNAKGDIRLPLVKSIHIAGLTQTEAQNKIEDSLKRYIKSPDIYFEVLNKRAYVIGEVNRPGEIDLPNERVNLLEALAKAGDLKDSANRQKIMILRPNGNGLDSQMVNLIDFNSLKVANLTIKPNDIVYVLPNNMKVFNTKVDEVNPIFRLISNALSPFITIKILSN
jgi:polysaccharide export outer membrane protein